MDHYWLYSREAFESFQPDDRLLLSLHDGSVIKGLIVTMKGKVAGNYPQYDFVSRYFAVWNGISEDPVTGNGVCFRLVVLKLG